MSSTYLGVTNKRGVELTSMKAAWEVGQSVRDDFTAYRTHNLLATIRRPDYEVPRKMGTRQQRTPILIVA